MSGVERGRAGHRKCFLIWQVQARIKDVEGIPPEHQRIVAMEQKDPAEVRQLESKQTPSA